MRRRNWLSVVVVSGLLVLSGVLASSASADTEPNNSFDQAQSITVGVGGTISASISPAGDLDYYRFAGVAGRTYTAELLNVATSLGDTSLYGYDAGHTELKSTYYCNGTGNVCDRIEFTTSLAGDYFLRVSGANNTKSGTYSIRVLQKYDEGLSRGADGEPNDTRALAEPITVGTAQALTRPISPRSSTYVTNDGDRDYFHFTGIAGHTYTAEVFNVAAGLGDTSLYGYDASGSELKSTYYCNGTGSVCDRIEFTTSLAGDYFLRVSGANNTKSGTYSIRVLQKYDEGLSRGADGEPNDTRALAEPITVGTAQALTRSIAPRSTLYVTNDGDRDYFHFTGIAGHTYTAEVFNVAAGLGDTSLYGYDASGSELKSTYYCNGTGSVCDRIEFTTSLAGDYFLRVTAANSAKTGSYSIRVSTPQSYQAGSFVALSPTRLLDTRTGNGAPGPSVPAGGTITVQITGRGGVPAGTSAVVLNVTAVAPTQPGYLTVYASGSARPSSSNLNFSAQQTVANLVVAPIGPDGKVRLFNGSSGSVQLLGDVAGYYRAGHPTVAGAFGALSPVRVLDTRTGNGTVRAAVPAGGTIVVPITGRGGVPAGTSAVVLNVTAVTPTRSGYLTVYADGTAAPASSNLNFNAQQTVANLVVAPVGADGKLRFFNGSSGTVQLLGDVAGYYRAGHPTVPGTFGALPPARVLDTRTGNGAARASVPAGGTIIVQIDGRAGVPSAGISAVVLNVTAAGPTRAGYLTVYADGSPRPGSSNVNFGAGRTVPNLVVAPVGADGRIRIFNGSAGSLQILADIAGYHLAAS